MFVFYSGYDANISKGYINIEKKLFEVYIMKFLYAQILIPDVLIQKFLRFGRNFCHFLRDSFILLFLLLRGENHEYKKDAEFHFEHSDTEISGTCQKFLPFSLTFFFMSISVARRRK